MKKLVLVAVPCAAALIVFLIFQSLFLAASSMENRYRHGYTLRNIMYGNSNNDWNSNIQLCH